MSISWCRSLTILRSHAKLRPMKAINTSGVEINLDFPLMSNAAWAACNMRYDPAPVPSMEKASEAAYRAVLAYLQVNITDNPDVAAILGLK